MKVLLVGGDGYVGSMLQKRLKSRHEVRVYDLARGQDVRNATEVQEMVKGQDVVICLASMSNNDWCEAHPEEAKSVNEDSFPNLVESSYENGVKRFIYASSVAAYGSSDHELKELDPLYPSTPYGRGKAFCEDYLKTHPSDMPYIITRSASVCGYSPRMRHDLTINKMVHDALKTGIIKVNGGEQYRCHIHMLDLCDFYELLLEAPLELIDGQVFNVVEKNEQIKETAQIVASTIGGIQVEIGPPTDNRSYRVSGKKAIDFLGWKPERTYVDAVHELVIMDKAHA